jgi:aminopeptidase N
MKLYLLALIGLLAFGNKVSGQDKLYCTNNHYRSWWNVVHYTLETTIPTTAASINGTVTIRAVATQHTIDTIQVDLQSPLQLSTVKVNGIYRPALKNGNAYLIPTGYIMKDDTFSVVLQYQGIPVQAKKAPWDGGFVRQKDEQGKPWIAVACQGIGASVWFPCKDYPGDEPELGADLYYTTDAAYTAVGNGTLIETNNNGATEKEWHWKVSKPINLYDITFYIGDYTHMRDTFRGLNGTLPLDYYVLKSNEAKARKQFEVVKPMLRAFEYWMGPYPFYPDGYKLVDAPYLGMEHQSAVADGDGYRLG